MDKTQLQCRGLSKSYGTFRFGPVDLSFSAGEITGVFGPNGAGKTTLISLLMGLIESDSGSISGMAESSSSGVFDHPLLLPQTKVATQVEALSRAVGLSDQKKDEIVDECGLAPYLGHRISKLSTGNKQRVCLALALIQDPDVYIFDEPLNGLDPDGIEWFNDKIQELARLGKTVILATHLLAEAESVVDRCLFLKHGQPIFQGRVGELPASIHHPAAYKYMPNLTRKHLPPEVQVVYSDKRSAVVYDPDGINVEGIPLDTYFQESTLPLSALYRIKSHDVQLGGGENE